MSTGDNRSKRDADGPTSVWRRGDREPHHAGTDMGVIPFDDLHLHRYCDTVPLRLVNPSGAEDWTDRPKGYVIGLPGTARAVELFPQEDETRGSASGEIRYLPTRTDEPSGDTVFAGFFSGTVRTALQYTPFIVAVLALVFVVSAELSSSVGGISAYLPSVPLIILPVLAIGAAVWGVLLGIVVGAGLVSGRELIRMAGVVGLLSLFALGTVGSIYLVVTAKDPRDLKPNIIYTSGYLLLILLGGLLTYDGMLRTEYLFNNLDEKLIVTEERKYSNYREQIANRLSDTTPSTPLPLVGAVPTAVLFAALLVSQFAGLWLVTSGPQHLSFSVTLVGNVLVDFIMAIIYFQLFVLIKAFHDLITGNVVFNDSDPVRHDLLSYRPFHPDGRGGFRDLGKFATRVNVLLLLGALYVIYRLYIQGARALPESGVALTLDPTLALLVWLVSYVGPVIVLIAVGFAWLYYSFWMLHVKMAHERERHYTERLRTKPERNGEDIGSVEDRLEWQEIRQPAPVWPVDARVLASLISSSFVPLLLALPRFLPL